jgi:acetyl esterase/lipase
MDVRIVAGQVYATPGGRPLLADLYLPGRTTGPAPVVLWLHGGGWKLGDRGLGPDLKRYFAASGIAMASIDYRLTAAATFPAQVHDVKTAVRWLRAVAPRYNLDADHIGLWGSSAGAHLAAFVALTGDGVFEPAEPEHAAHSSRVSAVVDAYGPVDLLRMDELRPKPSEVDIDPLAMQPVKRPSTDPNSFEALFIGAPIGKRSDLARAASPLTHVRPEAPPFLILHGLSDVAIGAGQSELLFDGLAAAGNDVELLLIEKLGHGFLDRPREWGEGRATTLRRASGGRREPDRPGPAAGYAYIEQFFRRHLVG